MDELDILGVYHRTRATFLGRHGWGGATVMKPWILSFRPPHSIGGWKVPPLTRGEAHSRLTVDHDPQVSDVVLTGGTVREGHVTVGRDASSCLFAGDDFCWKAVAVDQTDIIPDLVTRPCLGKVKLHLGVGWGQTSSRRTGRVGLSRPAILTTPVTPHFGPEPAAPSSIGYGVCVRRLVGKTDDTIWK